MQLTTEMIIAIAALLLGCIGVLSTCVAVLWRLQVVNNKRCESDGQRRDKKLDELDKFQRNELVAMRAESTSLAASSVAMLDRARRAIERAERKHPPGIDETPLSVQRSHA